MVITIDYIISVSIALLVNILSSCTGTLKTIFISKENKSMIYLTQILDAGLYAFILKMPSIDGTMFIITYTIGRLIGTVIANGLNECLGLEIINIEVYNKDYEKILKLQSNLIDAGYSSTIRKGLWAEDKERYDVEIQVRKKEYKNIQNIINFSCPKSTIIISPIKNVRGKITERKSLN